MARTTTALLLGLTLVLSAACTTIPATGQKAFIMVPLNQQIALGEQAEPQFNKDYGGTIPSPEIQNYVHRIGMSLAAVCELPPPNLPWDFHVVDSAVINAFALPGGKIFITRGLLSKLDNEAQVAGVLGHEIGHCTAEHVAQQMTQQLAIQIGLAGLGAAAETTNKDYLRVLGVGAQGGSTLYMLHFSRTDESQADTLGLRYMSKLGYNPGAMIQVMQILAREAGSGRPPEFLQTHPYPEQRMKDLDAQIKANATYRRGLDSEPNGFSFKPNEFKANVMDKLSRLPPPRSNGQTQ